MISKRRVELVIVYLYILRYKHDGPVIKFLTMSPIVSARSELQIETVIILSILWLLFKLLSSVALMPDSRFKSPKVLKRSQKSDLICAAAFVFSIGNN